MRRSYSWCGLFLLMLILLGCGIKPAASQSASKSEARTTPVSKPQSKYPEPIDITYTDKDSLSYDGYVVSKAYKKIKFEDVADPEPNSYAVLKKNGRVLATFFNHGLEYPLGIDTVFGLFPFLGGDSKQLVVEQSIPKTWAHWIVDLSAEPRIIFDSGEYGTSYELRPLDIDNDGIYEFQQTVVTFDYFNGLCHACSPLIDVVFRYDKKAKKYVPANQLFSGYALDGIEGDIAEVEQINKELKPADPINRDKYFGAVLKVVLRYIYTGNENEAWAFYEKEYKLSDKEEVKSKIIKELKDDPVYRFIYRKGAT